MLDVERTAVHRAWALAGATALLALAGCHGNVDSHGDKKDVNISTPFGGLQVRTNEAQVLETIGLSAYPGAVSVKNKNDGSADVNMHFGSFQLRVRAASYRTDDAPDKVESFYRDDLKRFGDVIACRNNKPVGEPTKTLAGLSCDDEGQRHISVDDSDSKNELQLKAGSRAHQHIVGIDPDKTGTKFALVVLDLPTGKTDDQQ